MFLTVVEIGKSKMKAQADSVSYGHQLPHWECFLIVTLQDRRGEEMRKLSRGSFKRAQFHSWELGPCDLFTSQSSTPSAIILGVKFSADELWEDTNIQSIAATCFYLCWENFKKNPRYSQIRIFALAVPSAWNTRWTCSWHSNLGSSVIFLKKSSSSKQAFSTV